MAMIKCPECGAEISTRAVSCVKCGLPMSEIYICPECGEVMFRSGKTVCSKCGCPIEDNPYVVNTESQRKGSYTVEEDNAAGADADAQYVAIAEKIIKKAFRVIRLIASEYIVNLEILSPMKEKLRPQRSLLIFL